MKNIKIKKFPVISVAVTAITISLLFTACLKDKGPVQDFSQSPALVSFQYTGFSAEPIQTSLLGTPTDSKDVEVTLSASSVTLSTAVSATITADDASLTDFNTANGTDYVQLDPSLYTLSNNGVVTINPGEQIVPLTVSFKGDQIDFSSTSWALALKITSATGATIATNLNTAILLIKLQNPYEGSYTASGFFFHPAASRSIPPQTKTLTTISPIRSLASQLGDLGGWEFAFDTDPTTGDLSNWGAAGATYPEPQSGFFTADNPGGWDYSNALPDQPGVAPWLQSQYNNYYDASTKTFWFHYGYGAGAVNQLGWGRNVYEKWIAQ
jgi:Domain of unknown function (DUF1735)